MEEWILVTHSHDKVEEFSRILGRRISSVNIDLPEIQSLDPVSVVASKARSAFERVNCPVLVEDTGLSLDAWGGLPGALIRWFIQSVGPEGICEMLRGFPTKAATASTAVAFCNGEVKTFVGNVSGRISDLPRGLLGFGWDRIFIPQGATKTFAEMEPTEKDQFSMRRLALEELRDALGGKRG